MESGIEMMPAQTTRKAELTSRSPISLLTGSWAASEGPRSPRTSRLAQLAYWTTTAWSRLSCWRSAWRLAGVAVRPRIARAGSPRAWVAAKTTIDTRTSTRSPSRIRRTMKTAIPARRTAAGEAWGRGPAIPLTEPDGAEAISECVQVQGPLAWLEALNLG